MVSSSNHPGEPPGESVTDTQTAASDNSSCTNKVCSTRSSSNTGRLIRAARHTLTKTSVCCTIQRKRLFSLQPAAPGSFPCTERQNEAITRGRERIIQNEPIHNPASILPMLPILPIHCRCTKRSQRSHFQPRAADSGAFSKRTHFPQRVRVGGHLAVGPTSCGFNRQHVYKTNPLISNSPKTDRRQPLTDSFL